MSIQKRTYVFLFVILGAGLVIFIGNLLGQSIPLRSPSGIGLRPPAFLSVAHAASLAQTDLSFIIDEAGITAYTKLNREISLTRLQPRFKTIREQTDEFISGIVIADGYSDYSDSTRAEVNVFVHADGWIVAYLTRWQIGAEIFDWANYDVKRLTNTLPENVVRSLLRDLTVSDFTVSHYDFRYPDATNLLLVAGHKTPSSNTGPFNIMIPRTLVVFESSWSLARTGDGGCGQNNTSLTNGSTREGGTLYLSFRVFSPTEFFQGEQQTFLPQTGHYSYQAYCGIAIIYSEAGQ